MNCNIVVNSFEAQGFSLFTARKISATKRERAGIVIDARRDCHNMAMQLVTPRVVAMAVAMETMS